jgi:two-component system cell cycle sensor histidine kinase PleC
MVANATQPTIMVVDDEPQVLAALSDTLEDDFNILMEASPLKAIDTIRHAADVSVVISDQRMPGLTGHEFLTHVRDISDATRILITGYSDMDAVIAAINSGGIFGYISKPWDPEKLRQLIRQAASQHGLLRALAEERRLLHSLMNNMPDAIYFKDRDRRFLRSNLAHARSLGVADPALLIGKTVADFLPADQTARMDEEDIRVLSAGTPLIDMPSRLEGEGGRPLWLSTTMAPIRDEQRQVTGLVAIARDVTARRMAEEELRQAHDMLERRVAERTADLTEAYERVESQALDLAATSKELAAARQAAEAASEAKSQFLAIMSHELRTPLTGLIGFSELLLRDDIDPTEFRHFLALQRDAAQTLHGLVSDILDFSKIEASRLELEIAPFPLRPIFSGCEALVAHTAHSKGLGLRVVCDDAVPAWVLGDQTRIRQIVLNLLSNAVKFTQSGEVVLRAAMVAGPDGAACLRVEVADTGIGIPADRLGHLFKPFSQVDSSTSRRFGGTGLGLAICKQLIDLMAGRIGVETEPDRGSTFWFEVALPRSDPPAEVAERQDAGSVFRRSHRVLIAEDNVMLQILLSTVLGKAGHEVEVVGNGAEAVEAVRTGDFDIVLMDSQMPVKDGIEATREIRAAETGARRLPIIALTANATDQGIQQCFDAGMNMFLPKPVDMDRLLGAIADLAAVYRAAAS